MGGGISGSGVYSGGYYKGCSLLCSLARGVLLPRARLFFLRAFGCRVTWVASGGVFVSVILGMWV